MLLPLLLDVISFTFVLESLHGLLVDEVPGFSFPDIE